MSPNMSPDDSQIGDAMQQQSFLHKVREYLIDVEEKRSALDEDAMTIEIDVSFAQQQIASLEKELQRYRLHAAELEDSDVLFQKRVRDLESQGMLLLDLEALLSGVFRRESAQFFTQSALDFASARSWGEMTLLERVAQTDGMILEIDGVAYAFLELEKEQYVFHPDALSDDFCKILKGFSD
jgi:hypothetical protein